MSRSAALLLGFLSCLGATPLPRSDPPLRICMISGSNEYHSGQSLAELQAYLEERTGARCEIVQGRGELNRFKEFGDLPGLDALDRADVVLIFTRRMTIEGEQLERIKKYVDAGRPVVGVRTASHAFQNWLEFDKTVLGGNYSGHFGAGPTQTVKGVAAARDHPVLDGISPFRSRASLYRTAPLAEDCEVLLTSETPEASQPAAWVRSHRGGRIFYTSLGGTEDFENGTFLRLLANALYWTAKREIRWKALPSPATRPKPEGSLRFRLRSRMETSKGSGVWNEVSLEREVPVAETAILICDMWDNHWCQGAARRCDVLAAKLAPVIEAARARGVQILHAPSETMGFYLDSNQRRRVSMAPAASPPPPIDLPDPPLPIDDSDGGCDTDEKPWYPAWTRQSARISIGEYDGIGDKGSEIYNFIVQRGIKNLIYMGVHTNMCVLNRTFAIKQMSRWGIRCYLVHDLTDSMYDPKDRPYVSHEEGTGLVVQHIEKHWAPTLTSVELLAALPSPRAR